MWIPRENEHQQQQRRQQQREGRERLIAVAIDKDKFSQHALKWAVDNILGGHQTVKLVHVIHQPPSHHHNSVGNNEELMKQQEDIQAMEVFLPFRCYCARRHIQCEFVVLERQDVARALIEYVSQYGVETLLLGAPSKTGLTRLFKASDVPVTVLKWAPDFCNVYIISKGKCNALRSATRPVPLILTAQPLNPGLVADEAANVIRSYDEFATPEMDMSFSSSGRPSTDSSFFAFYDNFGFNNMKSGNFDHHSSYLGSGRPPVNLTSLPELPTHSLDSGRTSCSSPSTEDIADENRRLKLELKQTMDMYHAACKEALTAKQKAMELGKWKTKEEKRLKDAHSSEERDKTTVKAAIEAAEAAQKIVKLEVQKRVNAEMKALKEAEEKMKLLDALGQSHMVLKYQSLFHILVVLFLFYFYLTVLRRKF